MSFKAIGCESPLLVVVTTIYPDKKITSIEWKLGRIKTHFYDYIEMNSLCHICAVKYVKICNK
jgi:hypothetical protein